MMFTLEKKRRRHLGDQTVGREPPPTKKARVVVDSWRRHYKTKRSHGSLGYKSLLNGVQTDAAYTSQGPSTLRTAGLSVNAPLLPARDVYKPPVGRDGVPSARTSRVPRHFQVPLMFGGAQHEISGTKPEHSGNSIASFLADREELDLSGFLPRCFT